MQRQQRARRESYDGDLTSQLDWLSPDGRLYKMNMLILTKSGTACIRNVAWDIRSILDKVLHHISFLTVPAAKTSLK